MIFFFVSDIEQNIMVFLKFTKRIGTKHLKMKQRNVEKSEEQQQNKNWGEQHSSVTVCPGENHQLYCVCV